MTPKQKWLLAGIIALAIFFRFYQIKQMPGGLFPDEAANGLDIVSMEHGDLQPFYERGNGREALFFYMEWASATIFGKVPWAFHATSAFAGLLAVLGCFLVTRKLFQLFSKDNDETGANRATNMALWAAFFMAVSSWHVVLSRTAFRANTLPLFASFTFYFGLLTYGAQTRGKRYFWSLVTGATFALGFYTYIAYRMMGPIIVIAVLWPLAVDVFKTPRFTAVKKFFGPFVALCISFAVFVSWIAYWFYHHFDYFIGRSGQVSIFNPSLNHGNLLGTFGAVVWASLKAFFIDGDLNWRHNISGHSFLSIMISPFFLIGLIGITYLAARYVFTPIKNKLDWKYFLLAGWFWGMLVPVVTTAEGIPHGLRSIGVIPSVFIIATIGLFWVVDLANKFVNKYWPMLSQWQQKALSFMFHFKTVVFIAALILETFILYFIYQANSPESFYAFRSDLTPVSQYLNDLPKDAANNRDNTYLILDQFSIQTVDYLTSPNIQPYHQVDPEHSWMLTNLHPGDKIVFTQSSVFDIKKFKQYHPEAKLSMEQRNKFNQTVLAVYTIQ